MNQSIPVPEEYVIPTGIIEHFIRQSKYRWIMDFCICREASSCKDYPIDLGCLFLGEAVQGIDSRLGRMATEEEAVAHVKRAEEAGLVHLIGRNKLDTLWLGIGPGHKLLTICHCCPCCCLWKMLPHLDDAIGRQVMKLPGVKVQVTDNCTGCGLCTEKICFLNAIRMNGSIAEIGDACRGCGRCVAMCPENAIGFEMTQNVISQDVIKQLEMFVDVT